MKMLSTASWVTPSGWKASTSIAAVWARRGAWERTPPLPTSRSRTIMSTRLSPVASWSKTSDRVRSLCTPLRPTASSRCWRRANRSASRATACSICSSFSMWGIVVGRIILFLMRSRRSASSMSKGIQRTTFSSEASARTLEML